MLEFRQEEPKVVLTPAAETEHAKYWTSISAQGVSPDPLPSSVAHKVKEGSQIDSVDTLLLIQDTELARVEKGTLIVQIGGVIKLLGAIPLNSTKDDYVSSLENQLVMLLNHAHNNKGHVILNFGNVDHFNLSRLYDIVVRQAALTSPILAQSLFKRLWPYDTWPHQAVQEYQEEVVEHNSLPPIAAIWLLDTFLDKKTRNDQIGDLTEEFEQRVEQRGDKYARAWLWGQVARSFWPNVKQNVTNSAAWLLRDVIGEWFRRLGS